MARIKLKGSDRVAMAGAQDMGPADPTERLEITVVIRDHAHDALQSRLAKIGHGDRSAGHLSRQEFARLHGATAADIATLQKFATTYGLIVVQEHAARRTVVLSGTVEKFNAAFQVELKHCSHAEGTYRGRSGSIHIPAELDGIVEAVLGLDNRPQARTHFRLRSTGSASGQSTPAAALAAAGTSYTPLEVASAYGFPSGTGEGQCVAIIELGGGYKPADLKHYFSALNVGSPKVTAVSVDHAKNAATGDANGPDGEVMLDIEVVGAIAPAAHVVVYFAPNTDAGFLDAITTAAHDTTHKPSVISISWGGPESSWTQQAMTAMDGAFQAAAAMGITVCVASGDNGSSDNATGDNVDFPAASPNVLACGGTTLQASGATISSEVVWNDGSQGGSTGGGVSSVFSLPSWQSGLKATRNDQAMPLAKRGVPDVAGNADPATGYQVRIDGTDTVIGGTSAVAPLWAALIARVNQNAASPVGFINPLLYSHQKALRDITSGTNGDYDAARGWDACTGLGTPDGSALGSAL
jgi:kumamolisin